MRCVRGDRAQPGACPPTLARRSAHKEETWTPRSSNCENIRKSFGPVEVLKGVNIQVYPGKVSALVGDNGAGKSTLIKGLSGAQPYDSGEVLFDGAAGHPGSPQDAPGTASRSSTRTSRCARTSTSSRTCSWAAKRPTSGMLDGAEMEKHASATLQVAVGAHHEVGAPEGLLAVRRSAPDRGDRPRGAAEGKVVILDEPTAALGVAQTEQVLELVRRLADAGVGVLIISHNLADVFQVADHINVLYLGNMVAQLKAKETNYNDVVGYITGIKGDTAAR